VIPYGLADGQRRFRGTCRAHLMKTSKKQNAKKDCYITDMLIVHTFEVITEKCNVVSSCAQKWVA